MNKMSETRAKTRSTKAKMEEAAATVEGYNTEGSDVTDGSSQWSLWLLLFMNFSDVIPEVVSTWTRFSASSDIAQKATSSFPIKPGAER